MKKLIVIALAVVMALSLVLVLAACGGETYEGEYSYFALVYEGSTPTGVSTTHKYGVKVHVTVNNGVITKVTVDDDTDTFYNLSASWSDKQKWIDGKDAFLASFEGLTVEEVNAIVVLPILSE